MSERIQIVLGALFVLLNAVQRFNTPPTNSSSTTAARYYGATLAYGALLIGTYSRSSSRPRSGTRAASAVTFRKD
jgi:hypothetical protein